MRLIKTDNTEELTFKEFDTTSLPPYAILSHCWEDPTEEVTFKDVQTQQKTQTSGYSKIVNFCKRAKARGLGWAWVDTCCIDKTSSAELTESINSMWSYYKKAQICYVFLADVGSKSELHKSKWWKRGWTLQELLAPSEVLFFDKEWKYIGSKGELASRIAGTTQIPEAVLNDVNDIMRYSVAQRLSWAAERQTTRPEDRAYSLLGIFRINMPLLYGEGEKAFRRLQIEILQKYADESVLAWHTSATDPQLVLAKDPDAFKDCSDVFIPDDIDSELEDVEPRIQGPPRVTSWGIEIYANARKLKPIKTLMIDGRYQRFLWAVTLTMSFEENIRELPCTLVLVQSGPAPFSYKRYRILHQNTGDMLEELNEEYRVGQLEADKLFYLTFDHDLLYE